MPKSETEIDRVNIEGHKIILKSYGLPLLFWGYLLAILALILIMGLSSQSIILKMLNYDDPVLNFLGYMTAATLILIPLILVAAFFYEKFIIKEKNSLEVWHRLFFICFIKKKYQLNENDQFSVDHFMDSPNVAKIKGDKSSRGFYNRGYYILSLKSSSRPEVILDRHSHQEDLEDLKKLLLKY